MSQDSEPLSDVVSRRRFLLTSGAVGATSLAGCTSGSDSTDTPDSGDGSGDGSDGGSDGSDGSSGSQNLSGDIRISGSSTVYPVAQEVSRRFQSPDFAGHDQVSFNLTRDGSSGGFENVFIPGDSDINNSSRPISQKEVQRCRDNGFEPVEFFIAQDALTIVVNNDADWIDSISLEDLKTIWSPDTAPETWSDVNSDWPDEPIDLYGAATTSGTFDYFTEAVVGEEGRSAKTSRAPNRTTSSRRASPAVSTRWGTSPLPTIRTTPIRSKHSASVKAGAAPSSRVSKALRAETTRWRARCSSTPT
ncbi:substrate-binding domain-containing protein [Halosimplex aquaticum]